MRKASAVRAPGYAGRWAGSCKVKRRVMYIEFKGDGLRWTWDDRLG